MRWLTGLVAAAVAFATAAGGGGWSSARPVAGVSFQADSAPYGQPNYVGASCTSPQDCTVAYQPPGKSTAVFSVTRHNGTWGRPRRVAGLRAEPGRGLWLACPSAGDCVLAVAAPAARGAQRVMVARLARGRWSRPQAVAGLAAQYPGDWTQVTALGCGRTGWCALAGQAEKPGDEGRGQPFVASEHNGTWSRAQAVPGLAALTRGWTADVAAVARSGSLILSTRRSSPP